MTMANGSPHDTFGFPSPAPSGSEGNSSVQVNLDSTSNRGRSVDRRSQSPSMRPSPSRGQSLARQATSNSLSSFLSSQSSSQPGQSDQAPAEDLLRDLIDATEAGGDVIRSLLQGVKRRHDDEEADEPHAKRDKLSEELERMLAAHPVPVTTAVASGLPNFSAPATTPPAAAANGAPAPGSGDSTLSNGTRGRLPFRPPGRRPPHLSNGTPMARSATPEGNEQANSGDDRSQHSSDGSRSRDRSG